MRKQFEKLSGLNEYSGSALKSPSNGLEGDCRHGCISIRGGQPSVAFAFLGDDVLPDLLFRVTKRRIDIFDIFDGVRIFGD